MKTKLSGVAETLLIPLWARAEETKRSDALIRDDFAVRLVEQIDYDFAKFARAKHSQTGVAVRSYIPMGRKKRQGDRETPSRHRLPQRTNPLRGIPLPLGLVRPPLRDSLVEQELQRQDCLPSFLSPLSRRGMS